jgi:hypothetical protein
LPPASSRSPWPATAVTRFFTRFFDRCSSEPNATDGGVVNVNAHELVNKIEHTRAQA